MAPPNKAPPSGPRGGYNSANGPRGGARGGPRGGIQKRRGGGPVRVDRDGDMVMDASTGGGGARQDRSGNGAGAQPRGRGGIGGRALQDGRQARETLNRASAGAKQRQILIRALGDDLGSLPRRVSPAPRGPGPHNQTDTQVLRVVGLQQSKAANNEDGGLRDLLSFLERKATTTGKLTRPVTIKKSNIRGDSVYILTTRENAAEILKVNGFSFAGTNLQVLEHVGGMPQDEPRPLSQQTLDTKAQLKEVLSRRYDGSQKLLNLSYLQQDEGLNAMGMFQENILPEKIFTALMAICESLFTSAQAKREAIHSVTLAGNSIDSVSRVMSLAETFPDLKNIDLSNNGIQDIKSLTRWKHRFPRLEALLMMGNPIETTNPDYRMELINWYPRLLNFNGTVVRTAEEVARIEEARKPRPIPQSGPNFNDVNGVGAQFLIDFFAMYDVDRVSLAAKYYDDASTFSLCVVTQLPRGPHATVVPWGAYIKFSRNLVKITTLPARVQRLFTGAAVIQTMWKGLPATRHPSLTESTKYIVDGGRMSGLPDPAGVNILGVDGFKIDMQGEFDEIDPASGQQSKRSFSRTFVLGPSKPGSTNPIRVVSDILTLRAWTPLPVVNESAGLTMEQRQQMVIELAQRTSMTPDYAELCLTSVNWSFDQALAMFNDRRAELPPEAFIQA